MQRSIMAVLFVITATTASYAQQENWYIGKPIENIVFDGLTSISKNELNGLMRSYLGQPYTDTLSWDIQSKLYALDYFDIIIPEIKDGSTGKNTVILVMGVQEKPLINKIVFSGNQKVRRGFLEDVTFIKEGDFLNSALFSVDEQAIKDLYLEKGFVDATVSVEHEINENKNQATITYIITEGTQTKISDILFVGNDNHVSDTRLRNLMTTKSQALFNKGLYVEAKLQEDIKAIERHYGDLGLIDAKVLNVDKQILFDEKDKFNKMLITITIEEGEIWTFGGVKFIGHNIYTLDELNALITQVPGETFNMTVFQKDFQNVVDLYVENGYIFNNISYNEERNNVTHEIFFNIEIVERNRAHIENILIRGNTKTKSYVILREFPLVEGAVFSKAKIYQGIMNLQNLRFFQAVDVKPYPGSQDGLLDMVIEVSEQETTQIAAGLTFSGGNDFPLAAMISWSNPNLLGRGQTLGFNLTASPVSQRIAAQFTEPRMLGNRWRGSFSLSYSHQKISQARQDNDLNGVPDPYITWEDFSSADKAIPRDSLMTYDSHFLSTGLGTGYTWIKPKGRLGLSTNLNFSWQFVTYEPDVFTPYNYLIRENLNTWKYSDSISLSAKWDTRDLLFDPSKGILLSQTLTFAGILESISNRNYIKSVTRFDLHHLLFDVPIGRKDKRFKSVFSFESAFNSIFEKPWREQTGNVVETNGFIIDGMFIARGWPFNTGDYYKYLWDNTLTLKFPLVTNILSFDIFLDAVGAWANTSGDESALDNWQGNDWRFSLGGGFRFANPQFPIGVYLVKRFQWKNNDFTWFPDDTDNQFYEFKDSGLDLVISFDIDIYR